jgi:hypothetical protein
MDKLDALDKRMEELNRIEHDIDYARPKKKPPLPAPVAAAPSSRVQNAGAEILGLRKPSTALSARSEIIQTNPKPRQAVLPPPTNINEPPAFMNLHMKKLE